MEQNEIKEQMESRSDLNVKKTSILTMEALVELNSEKDGMTVNEGYEYEVNGSIPQLADGIAKLAIEIDKQVEEFGENGGKLFLGLIMEYYAANKEQGGE